MYESYVSKLTFTTRYHVVEVTWGYSIFTRIIIPLLSTRALTTFELAYRTFCFLVYDLSTLSVMKFTVSIISNDIENTVLNILLKLMTHYYDSRLQ